MPLPPVVPLFPLPNVVLFPQVLLPLHIFEPRYRQMVRDAAEAEELIGMMLYRPCGEQPPELQPDIYSIGCAGRVIRKVDLPDGRFNILLQGVREFECREQFFDRPYRRAMVTWRPAVPAGVRLEGSRRRRLLDKIRVFNAKAAEPELRILEDPTLTDEMLVNLFAFASDIPVAEKQSLLELEHLEVRAERLIETLDFHVIERVFAPGSDVVKIRVQ
ncbi:MAG: LON peptidase substrate-binding domain-containing protein [Candidatus Binatia bacterium]